jgi:hypothetical protein
MKKIRRRNASVPRRRLPRPGSVATYSVGYGKPPREHQFQPGQSGNRKGRPKGAKNTATIVSEVLNRKVKVRTGDTVRKITVHEAMITGFADHGLKGDVKAAAFLLDRNDRAEAAEDQANTVTTPEEQEIIDEFVKEYLKKKGKKG